MQRHTFEQDVNLLSTITVAKLQKAQQEEETHKPISDPAVRLLCRHIYATSGRVTGSDQSWSQLCSQIWSTCIMLNPPTLWITINPCDLHDPIAQVFAGEAIDLDKFNSLLGPSKQKCAENVAADPYAAAKFFHFTIHTVLETLFGITVSSQKVLSTGGIFGHVSAYFGVVESQSRATLHLHVLLWLLNAPSTDEMETLLKKEHFRERMRAFIGANMRAYLPGFESADSVRTVPNEVEVAYSRPPNPKHSEYDNLLSDFERRVTRSKNLHTCELHRCLVPNKKGGLVCKRQAPFPIAEEDFFHKDGGWGPKCLYEFMNTWVPALTVNIWCNNDIKLLSNSREMMNVTFYITSYQMKKQG